MAMTGKEFFDLHIKYILAGDVIGMVENTYTEDATWYNPFPFLPEPAPNVIKGRVSLIDAMNKYFDYHKGSINVTSLYNFLDTPDVISFQSSFDSVQTGSWIVGNCWMMRDGKIHQHIGFAHRSALPANQSK